MRQPRPHHRGVYTIAFMRVGFVGGRETCSAPGTKRPWDGAESIAEKKILGVSPGAFIQNNRPGKNRPGSREEPKAKMLQSAPAHLSFAKPFVSHEIQIKQLSFAYA